MRRSTLTPREIAALNSLSVVGNLRSIAFGIVHDLDESLARSSAHVSVVYGARSAAEQLAIYAKGRVMRGGVWERTPGAVVYTNSTPEQSAHCYRAAVDIALLYDGDGADDQGTHRAGEWLPGAHPLWDQLATLYREHGLVAGRDWKRAFGPSGDAAHGEITDWHDRVKRGELTMVLG